MAYDDKAKWMMVSHGINWKGEVLDDTWTLDVKQGVWSRFLFPRSSLRPPKGALSAFVNTGEMLITIGGISGTSIFGHSNVWALSTNTMVWKTVVMMKQTGAHTYANASAPAGGAPKLWDADVMPLGRTQAVAVKLGAFGGLLEPILVLGGKANHAADGRPLNDIWLFDGVEREQPGQGSGDRSTPSVQDSMASFDGMELSLPCPCMR